MSKITIKTELKELIAQENDLSILKAIRAILKKTAIDPILWEKLSQRAILSEDVKQGLVLSQAEIVNPLPKKITRKSKKRQREDLHMEDVTEAFVDIFKSVKAMADIALEESRPRVEYIIKNKIKDQNTIDHLLDDLLNLVLGGADKELFFILLNYYKNVDEEGYNFHLNFYNKMTK